MELWKKLVISTFALIVLGFIVIGFEVLNSQPNIKQEVRISTLSDSLSLSLHAPKSDPVHSLLFEAKAEINGSATVQISHSGNVPPRVFDISKENPGFVYDGDWYHDHVILTLNPDSLTSGSLLISYTFYQ